MKVQIIQIPYDSGHRNLRAGRGPEHVVSNGLVEALQQDGHEVAVETVESQATFRTEVQTQFELYRTLARRVVQARQAGCFPLVLSGNCGATLGVIADTNKRQGIVWFDAHGEFNTPETTASGFLDGMGLAVATGHCWTRLAASIPGFRPIPPSQVVLIGGRDFDEGEKQRLEEAGVIVIDAASLEATGMSDALQRARSTLAGTVDEIHVHIDPDVFDPREAPANSFQIGMEGGMSVVQVGEAIRFIRKDWPITSATIASYDPEYDPQSKTLDGLLRLTQHILAEG
jgi:arginase